MKCELCENEAIKIYEDLNIISGIYFAEPVNVCGNHTNKEIEKFIENRKTYKIETLELCHPFKEAKKVSIFRNKNIDTL